MSFAEAEELRVSRIMLEFAAPREKMNPTEGTRDVQVKLSDRERHMESNNDRDSSLKSPVHGSGSEREGSRVARIMLEFAAPREKMNPTEGTRAVDLKFHDCESETKSHTGNESSLKVGVGWKFVERE
jgi:hypothetical protein